MAIEKRIDIIVDTSKATANVDNLEDSFDSLNKTSGTLTNTVGKTTQAVTDNGGAMGLLNMVTGGLAQTFKDALEASSLFGKESKIGMATQKAYAFVMGTSTGAMKAFKIALIGTGIGALVVGVGLLIANFDKVKKAVTNLIPGFDTIAKFIGTIVDAITDFVGVTSDLTRELDKFNDKANKALQNNADVMDAYGDLLDDYAKKRIDAQNRMNDAIVAINAREDIQGKEKRAKILEQELRFDRELKAIESGRLKDIQNEKDKAQADANAKAKIADDKRKADKEREFKESFDFAVKMAQLGRDIDEQKRLQREQVAQDEYNEMVAEIDASIALDKKLQDEKKRLTDEELVRSEAVEYAKRSLTQQTFALLTEVAGRGSKIGKALALAQATISGIEGVQNAFTTASKSPLAITFPAYPFVQAGLAGAFSALQIKKILSTNPSKGGGGGSSSGGGGVSAPSAPSFNLVAGTGTNQIAQGLAGQQQPLQAFVVGSAVTTQASMDRNIVETASLG